MEQPEDYYLYQYLNDDLAQDQKQVVDEWLSGSERNRAYLDKLDLGRKARKVKYETYHPSVEQAWSEVENRISDVPEIPLVHWKTWVYRVAAVLVLALGVVFLLNRSISEKQWYKHQAIQGNEEIRLLDGSQVTLKQGSSLTYTDQFGDEYRQVVLEGEAFFEVKRDETRPFIIATGETSTTVLGTSFNIRQQEQAVTVTVVSGRVSLSELNSEQEVILVKGEAGTYLTTSQQLVKDKNKDPNLLSWKTGRLVFDNQPLEVVLKDLSRHYDIEMLSDRTLEETLTVEFNQQKLEEVLTIISTTLDLEITRESQRIYRIN